jgi:hypothetical protein
VESIYQPIQLKSLLQTEMPVPDIYPLLQVLPGHLYYNCHTLALLYHSLFLNKAASLRTPGNLSADARPFNTPATIIIDITE